MTEPQAPLPPGADPTTPEAENRNHNYRSHAIPWFVHLIWVAYWILAIYYVVSYLFPAIQGELRTPP